MTLSPQTAKPVSLQKVAEILFSGQKIALLSHYRPDGDAVGSTLALASVLRSLGKEVFALNIDETPDFLKFLEAGGEKVLISPSEEALKTVDLIVALDCATIERLGHDLLTKLPSCPVLTIDHHVTNECYGDYLYLDGHAAATGEILFDLFELSQMTLPLQAREALYTAISTDTGSLQYANTSAKTYRIMSELVSMGVEVAALNTRLYFNHSPRRLAILKEALQSLELSFEGQVSSWMVPYEAKERVGIRAGEMVGLMDLLRGVSGVRLCFTLDEASNGEVRLSMRSKEEGIDVSQICAAFGGGGHRMAAGATLEGAFLQSRELVLAEIAKAL